MNWAEIIGPILSALAGGAACYAAIRADLADLKARTLNVEHSTNRAHERIDNWRK